MEGTMIDSGVSKEHLQTLGREAASMYSAHKGTMTDAVISVLHKEAGLSSEHVKRVIEVANNEAYRDEFDMMDGDHRIVNIDGGPADPGRVLRELEMSDNAPALVKSAARAESLRPFIPGEDEFEGYFDQSKIAHEVPLPEAHPHSQLIDLRAKLASVKEHMTSSLSAAEVDFDDAANIMYGKVKIAVLGGMSPAEVSVMYQRVSPNPVFTKLALRLISNKMDTEDIPAVPIVQGNIKQASSRMINKKHPIINTFLEFTKTASRRVELLEGLDEVEVQLKRVNKALHEAMR